MQFNITSEESQNAEALSEGGGFHFLPLVGGANQSKFARVGMTLGSMIAVMTCTLALFTEGMPPVEDNYMGSIAHLRHLKALDTDREEYLEDKFQSLQDLKNTYSFKSTQQSKNETHITKYFDDGRQQYPCDQRNAQDFLKKINMLEDIREDYIRKMMDQFCNEEMFLTVDNFEDEEDFLGTIPTVYESPKSAWRATKRLDQPQSEIPYYCNTNKMQQKHNELNMETTTLYAEKPQLILPVDKHGKFKMLDPSIK